MTAALCILWLHLSPPSPSSFDEIKSIIDTFWYWITQVHLEKIAIKMAKTVVHMTYMK